jgi:hypothetical protein
MQYTYPTILSHDVIDELPRGDLLNNAKNESKKENQKSEDRLCGGHQAYKLLLTIAQIPIATSRIS